MFSVHPSSSGRSQASSSRAARGGKQKQKRPSTQGVGVGEVLNSKTKQKQERPDQQIQGVGVVEVLYLLHGEITVGQIRSEIRVKRATNVRCLSTCNRTRSYLIPITYVSEVLARKHPPPEPKTGEGRDMKNLWAIARTKKKLLANLQYITSATDGMKMLTGISLKATTDRGGRW